MKDKFSLTVLAAIGAIFILAFALTVSAHENQCNANNPENCPIPTQICNNGEHTGNPHCQPSPTSTPEVTETPIPTVNPCDELTEEVAPNAPCVTPTASPSATLTPTTTPTQTPQQGKEETKTAGNSAEVKGITITPCRPGVCGWK